MKRWLITILTGLNVCPVLAVSDVRVRFPGAEEVIRQWQGSLIPVVTYR